MAVLINSIMTAPTGHRTRAVPVPRMGGATLDIDVRLVPLIRELWARGFGTLGCCEDDPPGSGQAWIAFCEGADATAFAGLCRDATTMPYELRDEATGEVYATGVRVIFPLSERGALRLAVASGRVAPVEVFRVMSVSSHSAE